jgi:putative oxidoreductase
MMTMLVSTLQLILTLVLSYVFLIAAVHKLRDPVRYKQLLLDYDLSPSQFIAAQVVLLALLELMTSLFLLVPSTVTLGAGVASALLVLYVLVILISLIRAKQIDSCGCDGSQHSYGLSVWLIVRNLCLLIGAASLWVFSTTTEAILILAIPAGVFYVILYQASAQWLSNNSKLNKLREYYA